MRGSATAVARLPLGALAGADGRCCWLFARWSAPAGRISGFLRPFAGFGEIAAIDPLTEIGAFRAIGRWVRARRHEGQAPLLALRWSP